MGDPVRRRILELLADGELSAGEIGDAVQEEFAISQPAVSQHLRVLREHGFATVRPEGRRRLYAVDPRGPREASDWLSPFERFWLPRLDALGTELARGKRERRLAAGQPPTTHPDEAHHAPHAPASNLPPPHEGDLTWSTSPPS
nr:metalloregulator ArsR/SmtB family transcription factor [Brachybacterium sacelli]